MTYDLKRAEDRTTEPGDAHGVMGIPDTGAPYTFSWANLKKWVRLSFAGATEPDVKDGVGGSADTAARSDHQHELSDAYATAAAAREGIFELSSSTDNAIMDSLLLTERAGGVSARDKYYVSGGDAGGLRGKLIRRNSTALPGGVDQATFRANFATYWETILDDGGGGGGVEDDTTTFWWEEATPLGTSSSQQNGRQWSLGNGAVSVPVYIEDNYYVKSLALVIANKYASFTTDISVVNLTVAIETVDGSSATAAGSSTDVTDLDVTIATATDNYHSAVAEFTKDQISLSAGSWIRPYTKAGSTGGGQAVLILTLAKESGGGGQFDENLLQGNDIAIWRAGPEYPINYIVEYHGNLYIKLHDSTGEQIPPDPTDGNFWARITNTQDASQVDSTIGPRPGSEAQSDVASWLEYLAGIVHPDVTSWDVSGDTGPAAGSIAGLEYVCRWTVGQPSHAESARIVGFEGIERDPSSVAVLGTIAQADVHSGIATVTIPDNTTLAAGDTYTIRLEVYEEHQRVGTDPPVAYADARITAHDISNAFYHWGRVEWTSNDETAQSIADRVVFADNDLETGTHLDTSDGYIAEPGATGGWVFYLAAASGKHLPTGWLSFGLPANNAFEPIVDREIDDVTYAFFVTDPQLYRTAADGSVVYTPVG